MRERWEPVNGQEAHLEFARAAAKILADGAPIACPLCTASALRFYCHKFDYEKNKGTIWVWCPTCRKWSHVSRLVMDFDYPDPYSDVAPGEFLSMERSNWLDRLNYLWEQNAIPIVLQVHSR